MVLFRTAVLALALANVPTCASAQVFFGDWGTGTTSAGGGLFAATINDSKAIFGQYCYPSAGNCYWLLANDIDCETGSKYPVLINSDAGASSQEVYCFRYGGKPSMAFADFSTIDRIARTSTRLAVAFPMKSGLFQVNRFSLDGAGKALDAMRDAAQTLMQKDTSTKDRVL